MLVRKAFRFRLDLGVEKRQACAHFAGCCRFVWNKALALQKDLLEAGAHCFSYCELSAELKTWKRQKEFFFLRDCHSQPLQQTLMNLHKALREAFNKKSPKRFPRFKKKGKRDSFRFPQGFKVDEANSRIYLPKIGWVKYRKSRTIVGVPKNVTVSRRGDYWYVSIQTETEIRPRACSNSIIGGDLGIARFLTLSTGDYFEPLNSFKNQAAKLSRLQRSLARKTKGSNNWLKAKRKISRLHIRIADARRDYLHKITHNLSKNHAVVVLEDLKVANLSKSAKGTLEEPGKNVKSKSGLNRSIMDQGWFEFKRQIDYKLKWSGGMLVLVNPKNTSQRCPGCGYTSKANRKTQSNFTCMECGYESNADLVGALNVLRAGHARLACGESPIGISMKQEPTQMAIF